MSSLGTGWNLYDASDEFRNSLNQVLREKQEVYLYSWSIKLESGVIEKVNAVSRLHALDIVRDKGITDKIQYVRQGKKVK